MTGRTRTLAVVTAGLSQPSSTMMLADRLAQATSARLAERGIPTEVRIFELRDVALDVMNNMLTGFPSPKLDAVIEAVTGHPDPPVHDRRVVQPDRRLPALDLTPFPA